MDSHEPFLRRKVWDVSDQMGKKAHLEIVDEGSLEWTQVLIERCPDLVLPFGGRLRGE